MEKKPKTPLYQMNEIPDNHRWFIKIEPLVVRNIWNPPTHRTITITLQDATKEQHTTKKDRNTEEKKYNQKGSNTGENAGG